MNPILRNVLAVIAGVVTGSLVNMAIISINGSLIPLPEGADVSSMEGLKASMPLFEPKHFVVPFLAHALGTLMGALVTALLVTRHPRRFALGLGFYFFLGGVAAVFMVPAPAWFSAVDLIFAYIPMALLAATIAERRRRASQPTGI
jgi:hypothetical protein